MAGALYFSRRVKSCFLRSYLWKSFVLFETRCNYNSGVFNVSFSSGRRWGTRRSLSTTNVGKSQFENNTVHRNFEYQDTDRRIMVVLRKKKGENVPQLHEQDLLDYFSSYGEVTDVKWVRTKEGDLTTGKGFGFVSFASAASFQEAVASKDHTMKGTSVYVLPAKRASSQPARAASDTTVVSERQAAVSLEKDSEAPATNDKAASVAASMTISSRPLEAPGWMTSASDQVVSSATSPGAAPEPMVAPEKTASASFQPVRQTTPVEREPLHKASVNAESMQAAEPHEKNAQAASMHVASMHSPYAQTALVQRRSLESPEDQKRKILVTKRRGCKGDLTLKALQDYFSVFGKIELIQENNDLVYIIFESPESVERVMMVTNHWISDIMVLVSLAYSNQQRKQLRLEKAMDDMKMKQNPRSVKMAEREGRKIVVMTPFRFKESISKEIVEKYFSSYGAIEETFIMESKGYGFVIFKESSVAEEVLKCQNHKIVDVDIYVKMSLATKQITQNGGEEKKRIIVSNISGETSERDIWQYFAQFGKVAEVLFAGSPDGDERKDSCVVAYDSIDDGLWSVIGKPYQISTQQDALVVNIAEDQLAVSPNVGRLYVNNVPENMTLEMLRSYFEEFGLIKYLGFTRYHSKEMMSTLMPQGVLIVFCDEIACEKALQKTVYKINSCKVRVHSPMHKFSKEVSDFQSLRILMTSLPADIDELDVENYLLQHSCRVKSLKFLSETVCIASLWNLHDVDRLVKLESEQGHFIGGNPISLRRYNWFRQQEEVY